MSETIGAYMEGPGLEPEEAADQQTKLSFFLTGSQREVSARSWDPGAETTPKCARCKTQVSHAFHRQWSDNDGVLDGCRHCLPRSVRFGEDVYGRTKDEAQEQYDLEAPNKGRDAEDRRNKQPPNS